MPLGSFPRYLCSLLKLGEGKRKEEGETEGHLISVGRQLLAFVYVSFTHFLTSPGRFFLILSLKLGNSRKMCLRLDCSLAILLRSRWNQANPSKRCFLREEGKKLYFYDCLLFFAMSRFMICFHIIIKLKLVSNEEFEPGTLYLVCLYSWA